MRRLAGRGAARRARAAPGRAADRARFGAGRRRRPDLEGLGPAHRPDAATPANTPNRLTATSSVRARYWERGARRLQATRQLVGAGRRRLRDRARATATQHARRPPRARLRRADARRPRAGRPGAVAARARRLGRRGARRDRRCGARDRGLPWDAERIGLATLARSSLVFGVHSLIDWTWFVPGNACAGCCAPAGSPAAGRCATAWRSARQPPRRRPRATPALAHACSDIAPGRGVARSRSAAQLIVALAASWAAFQPVRSVHAGGAVFDAGRSAANSTRRRIARIGERAIRCRSTRCSSSPSSRRCDNPAGRAGCAPRAVRAARQPRHVAAPRPPAPVCSTSPRGRCTTFRAAYYLDPVSPVSASDFLAATRTARGGGPSPSVWTTPEIR